MAFRTDSASALPDIGLDDLSASIAAWDVSYDDKAQEVEALRNALRQLNAQLYQERAQWIKAQERLQQPALPPAGPPSNSGSNSSMGSPYNRRHTAHAATQARPGGSDTGSPVGPCNCSTSRSLKQQLVTAQAQVKGLEEQLRVMQASARAWNIERLALQRQADVLQAAQEDREGHTSKDDRISLLTSQLEAMTAERDALKDQLELVASSFADSLGAQQGQAQGLSRGQVHSLRLAASHPLETGSGNSSTSAQLSGSLTDRPIATDTVLTASVQLPSSYQELAATQEQLRLAQQELQALAGVHKERAKLEEALRAVEREADDLRRLNRMLEDEIKLIREEHVPVTMQEYQGLLQAQAERDALLLKTEAQSKHFKLVGQEELLELQAARRSAAALEVQVAALSAAASAGQDEKQKALADAHEKVASLQRELLDAQSNIESLSRDLIEAEAQANAAASLRQRVLELEGVVNTVSQERARLELRLRCAEEDLASAKTTLQATLAERARLACDLGAALDAHGAERRECEARVAAVRQEKEGLEQELVSAKLELARLREMEVLYRRAVVNAKVQLWGTPAQEAAAVQSQ